MESFKTPKGYTIKAQTASAPKKKELWLVQLPKNFDIKKLENLPVNGTFTQGKKKRTYEVSESDMDTEQGRTIYLTKPIKETKGQQIKVSTKHKISKLLTISRVATIPEIDYGQAVQPKPLVEQKQGLELKHWATGYGPEANGTSAVPQSTPEKAKKRHHDDEPKSDKKSKKQKKEKKDKKEKK